jgi:hypothetical protein
MFFCTETIKIQNCSQMLLYKEQTVMFAGMFNTYCCFRFESEAAAIAGLHRLHQLNILGYPLTVEYARGVADDDSSLVQSEE